MIPPMVCFITWNRAGLTARNLTALLNTTDDFELYIIDNNSQDNTWNYLETVHDDRIKEKKRFDINRGVIYALNYLLSKRKKDQYYLVFEPDIYIKTKDWITQFLRVMDTFPEVGLLGTALGTAQNIITKDDVSYCQSNTVAGYCCCFRPEVFDYVGYWNEETGIADSDMSSRIYYFSPYKLGFVPTIQIEVQQSIPCEQCILKKQCPLLDKSRTCFDIYRSKYKHREYVDLMGGKNPYLPELWDGKRTAYCASIHDPDSIKKHFYQKEWAEEIFQYFIKNAN